MAEDKPERRHDPTIIERRRCALRFLKNLAFEAHYDGDALRVNHLCALAADNVRRWQQEQDPGVRSPYDIVWVFALATHWFAHDYMYYVLNLLCSRHIAPGSAPDPDVGPRKFLQVVSHFVMASIDTKKVELQHLKNEEFKWVSEENETEAAILLSTVIELCWATQDDDHWLEIAEEWSTRLSWAHASLDELVMRLSLQTRVLFPTRRVRSCEAPSNEHRMMLDGWSHFVALKKNQLQSVIENLAARSDAGSRWALPLWSMRHYYRMVINGGDDQATGLTRRAFLAHSQGQFHYQELLNTAYLKALSAALATREEKSRVSAERFAILEQIAASRTWDIGEVLTARRKLAEASALREVMSSEQAKKAVLVAVESLWFPEKDTPLRTCLLRVEMDVDRSHLQFLVEQLMRVLPVQRYDAYLVFKQLSDAIPEGNLVSFAQWFEGYIQQSDEGIRGWHWFPLEIWADILEYCSVPDEAMSVLFRIALPFAAEPRAWTYGKFWETFLVHAPMDMVLAITAKMFAPSADSSDNERRWTIVYNAAVERADLGPQLLDLLRKTATSDLAPYLLNLENPTPGTAFTDEKMRLWYVRRITAHVRAVNSRQHTRGLRIDFGVSPNGVKRITWRDTDIPLIKEIIQAIKAPFVRSFEIHRFLGYLAAFHDSGPVELRSLITAAVLGWLDALPTGQQDLLFGCERSELDAAFMQLLVSVVDGCEADVRTRVADWIFRTPVVGTVEVLAQRVLLEGQLSVAADEALSRNLTSVARRDMALLAAQLSKPATTTRGVVHMLREFHGMIENLRSNAPQGNLFQEAGKSILDLFMAYTSSLAGSTDPDVRAAFATLLRGLGALAPLPSDADAILKQLVSDPRGRVRLAAKGER